MHQLVRRNDTNSDGSKREEGEKPGPAVARVANLYGRTPGRTSQRSKGK